MNTDSRSKPLTRKKTSVTARLIRQKIGSHFEKILVVGCGTGLEAVVLAREFKAKVIGIDTDELAFDPPVAEEVDLRIGDATCLDFADHAFDLVFSFHVLEHIPRFTVALAEMARVLKAQGGFFIGVPNRARWVGYLGSDNVNWRQKIKWNWNDWRARVRGKFKNEFGAHAGFLPQELRDELQKVFSQTEEVTLDYYLEQYDRNSTLVRFLYRSGLGRYLFPAIFFIGRK